ncbi:MAG: hypothetical protein H6934_04265 [Burkholderiaceae bacterium]|nr:hypothetical protein [Burkholderiaceae bacterium]
MKLLSKHPARAGLLAIIGLALLGVHAVSLAASPKAAGTAHCRQLRGIEREACMKCEGQGRSKMSEMACKEGVKIAYCAKRVLENDPDCQAETPTSNF